MLAIPAIDLINGQYVRLREGSFDTKKVYGSSPADIAAQFAASGVTRLHVVDLDAARGTGNNRNTIKKIRKAFPGILDVGGGIRTFDDALELRDIGVDLLVLGTVLVKNPEEVERWQAKLGRILVAGIDAKDGDVKIAGWESGSSVAADKLAAKVAEIGVSEIIYTDISRDGTMSGPNIEATERIAEASGLPVIISGGVGGMDDIRDIARKAGRGISGVIFGKAFYEGKIDISQVMKILEKQI